MRPIKFRYFDEVKKQMTYSDDLQSLEGFFCHYESGSNILMQFTGLHDRKGIPIFENDILWMKGGGYMRVVRWSEEDASFSFNKTGLTFCKSNEKWMEIIGNLMQNPELLDNK